MNYETKTETQIPECVASQEEWGQLQEIDEQFGRLKRERLENMQSLAQKLSEEFRAVPVEITASSVKVTYSRFTSFEYRTELEKTTEYDVDISDHPISGIRFQVLQEPQYLDRKSQRVKSPDPKLIWRGRGPYRGSAAADFVGDIVHLEDLVAQDSSV